MTKGDLLYNVKKVILTELDPITGLAKGGATPINIDCDSDVELAPVVSKGEEKIKRDDTQILAIARTMDLLYGYGLKMTNATFDTAVASLIEGGITRMSGDTVVGYDSPKLADGVTMKPFKADIYISNYDGDSIKNYVKLTLNKCTGTAPSLTFKTDFFAPAFDIDARENTLANLPIKTLDYVDSLPTSDETAPVLTLTSTAEVVKPAPIIAKSNELGVLYAVDSSANVTSATQLNMLITLGLGSATSISLANTDTSIATSTLPVGTYKVYAVDYSGNVSVGSIEITIS